MFGVFDLMKNEGFFNVLFEEIKQCISLVRL